jgi:putative redox protein
LFRKSFNGSSNARRTFVERPSNVRYNPPMREVTVGWAGGPFAQDVSVAGHRLRADEQREKGGEDSGATPHELLLAALGSCTAMTMKVYAERKGWPLKDVRVTLAGDHVDGAFVITRQFALEGELDAEQRQRIIDIADKCPVHKTLSGAIKITTIQGES